jgi:hypothetical protein
MRLAPLTLVPFLLAGCAAALVSPEPSAPASVSSQATRVLDRDAAERLLANKGVTLQWISWDQRGSGNARWEGDRLLLTAAQAKTSEGRLFLDGQVTEIGSDYFIFRGTIRIEDAPDAGRRCEATKDWRFAITQSRPYWRLREFEWCDGLTDYIDIYF